MTSNSTQDPRWAQAEAILSGRRDPPAFPTSGMRHHRGYTALMTMIVVLLLVGIAGIGLARGGHHVSHHPVHHSTSIPLWRAILAALAFVIGVVLGVVGIVLMVRTGLFGRRWTSAVSVLGQRQKNQLRREIAGRAPLDPAHLPLARDFALRMTHQRSFTLVIIGVAVMELGTAVAVFSLDALWLVAVAVVMVAVVLLTSYRSSRQGRRFLDQHPAEGN